VARGHQGRDRDDRDRDSEFIDKLVHINRVAKVVKGGRRFGFAALVIVGDQKGRAGFGHGKAREVPEAIRKATEAAKRNLIKVPLREGRTLHHDVTGRFDPPREFVLPGQNAIAAALDFARTIIRRAERVAVAATRVGWLGAESHVVPYLNRLADLVYTLSRWQEGDFRPSRQP